MNLRPLMRRFVDLGLWLIPVAFAPSGFVYYYVEVSVGIIIICCIVLSIWELSEFLSRKGWW